MSKHTLFLIFFGLVFCFSSKANDMYDIVTHQKHEINHYSKAYKASKAYFKKTIEIDFHGFKTDVLKSKKITENIYQIGIDYIDNEINYLSIIRDANSRVDFCNEIEKSKNTYSDEKFIYPELKAITIEIVSMINNRVLYEIKLTFEAKNTNEDSYDSSKEFVIKEYYLANLTDASIQKWKPLVKESNQKKIEEQLFKKLQEQYLIVTKKLIASEVFDKHNFSKNDENTLELSNFVSIAKKIDVSQADYFWSKNGLIVQFQEYKEGNLLYNGKFFNLFFSYKEALELMQYFPEFSFISSSIKTTTIKNFNNMDAFYKKLSSFYAEPKIQDFIENESVSKKIKTLTQTNYQISSNSNKRFQGKTITEFDANQNILTITMYDENNKVYGTTFYEYDSNNNRTLMLKKEKNRTDTYIFYEYDAQNNLKKTTTIIDDDIYFSSYYYAANYVYNATSTLFKESLYNFYQYELSSSYYKTDEVTYKLNTSNEIIGVITSKNFSSQVQMGRDKNGKIVETHKEDDRYNYYFEYDRLERLEKYFVYEYAEEQTSVIYSYDSSEKLPSKKSKTYTSGGNSTFLEEIYEWIYFE